MRKRTWCFLVMLSLIVSTVVFIGTGLIASAEEVKETSEELLKAPIQSGSVVSINGIGYNTIKEALDNAEEGDTIVLQKDASETILINKSITLDLNGLKLEDSDKEDDEPTIKIENEDKDIVVTIKNGTIGGGDAKYATSASAIEVSDAVLNLEDVKITDVKGAGYAIRISAYSDIGSDFSFSSVVFDNLSAHALSGGTKNDISFKNCEFINNVPEGTNVLVNFGGRGNKTFENCVFKGNKAQGIISCDGIYTNCIFEDNECQDLATIGDSYGDGNFIFNDTVVKNNRCTNEFGIAGVDVTNLELNNSAIYNNVNSAGGRNDLGRELSEIDVTAMKDPTDESMDFSEFGVDEKGTVKKMQLIFEAEIDEIKYKKLSEAVKSAKDGETIKIINTNGTGDVAPIDVNTLWIQKTLIIDLNGRSVTSNKDGWSFCIAGEDGKLSIINSSDKDVVLEGQIYNYDMDCSLEIGDKIHVSSYIKLNGNTIIDGTHEELNFSSSSDLNNGKTMPVTFGKNFKYIGKEYSLRFELAESKEDLNDTEKYMPDIIIAHGATRDLVDKIHLDDITNPFVTVVFKAITRSGEEGDLIVKKSAGSIIYLDGKNGDDSKDGRTKSTAVKTFAKANELVEAMANDNERIVVYVIGTVNVDDDETWEFANYEKTLMLRDPEFKGNLVNINSNGKLTLRNIVIDGNKNNIKMGGTPLKDSLIRIKGGTLNVDDGAVLQNNKLNDMTAYPPSAGGAIYVENDGALNLNGGTITGNTAVWGGGVFALRGTININDGFITDNHAVDADDDHASGGGIATWYESKVNIKGGMISNNTSEGNAGGLSLGVSRVSPNGYSTLNMTGGTFEGNVARDSGGGLFVQGGLNDNYSRAYVSGGFFTNNTAKSGFFGGGGIYVNGSHNWEGFHSGELYLTNALVTENDAGLAGGGYAACPTSKTDIRVKNGVALYENTAPEGKEIHINSSVIWHGTGATPEFEIANSMLGGVPYHWYYDSDDNRGKEVPLNELFGILPMYNEFNLGNSITSNEAVSAENLAKVFITGNHAGQRGGGIGSNGDVYIGTRELTEVKVNKVWKDANYESNRPDIIKIGLFRKLSGSNEEPVYIGYETIKKDADGNWTKTLKNLPKTDDSGKLYEYTVKEIINDTENMNYLLKSEGSVSGEPGEIEITNIYETIDIKVTKVWKSDINNKLPDAITINLLANGKKIKTEIVTEDDDWKCSFKNMPKYNNGEEIEYTVEEEKIDGYETSISGNAKDGFVITNTIKGKISIPVSKKWVGKEGTSAKIHLVADGEKKETIELNERNNWQYTFENLEQYKDGEEIEYTVEEEKIDGYEISISGNAKDGFVITNKEIVTKKVIINTGDDSGMLMYLFMFSIAALTLVFLSLKKRRIEN